MGKWFALIVGAALAIVTPVMAADQDPADDPAITEARRAEARAEAREAQYKAEKAEADARLAPLRQFAGDGSTRLENGGGQMETAYLAATTVAEIARLIHERVAPEFSAGTSNLPVLLLTNDEPMTFDAYSSFRMEVSGIIGASVRVLNLRGPNCPARPATGLDPNDLVPRALIGTAGAIIGMLQSETRISGFDLTSDDALLVNAIAAGAEDKYIRQGALLTPAEPDANDPINVLLSNIEDCEAELRRTIARMPKQTDDQKAAVAVVQAVLTRLTGFVDRLTTPATDGGIRLALVVRQSHLMRNANNLVLRVRVNRTGGTMITVKNLFTALGLPAVRLSGGTIGSFTLTDRSTGLVRMSGMIVCRTELTGLRSAIRLRRSGLVCATEPPAPGAPRNAEEESRQREARQLQYDPLIFRPN